MMFFLTADFRKHTQTVFFPWPTGPGKTCMPFRQTGFTQDPGFKPNEF
jgi:hypothetical protein